MTEALMYNPTLILAASGERMGGREQNVCVNTCRCERCVHLHIRVGTHSFCECVYCAILLQKSNQLTVMCVYNMLIIFLYDLVLIQDIWH